MSKKGINWSAADQESLDALTKRKEQFEEQRMGALMQVVMGLNPVSEFNVCPRSFALALRANADALRDALAPFDSGLRCATQD